MQVGRITPLEPYDVRTFAEKVQSVVRAAMVVKADEPPRQRPSWDNYFAQAALHAATRSTCPRAQVGCVMVHDNLALVTGFNGAPRGMDHCTDVGCLIENNHCIRSLHAEQNAIIQAARTGVSLVGATAFVTHHPCALCANMLINVGVVRVVYLNMYPPADGGEFLRQAGVIVERIEL